MSTMTERLALLVDLRSDDAIRGLSNLERNAARSLGSTEDGIARVGDRMTRIGASMLGAGTLAAAGLVNATHATADLNEAVNLTGLIFGDARDEIDRLARASVDAVGLSERAYREATGQLGGLLQNLGFAQDETVEWSADLVQLAADMGSSFNRDPAIAVEALGSALRGESEPIRQFNVMLDDASVRARAVEMGLADTAAEVTRNGLAQARLSLIMEQTSRIQGDFANTSDGAANAQRRFQANFENFRAELGEQVLPVMEDVLAIGNQFLGWFGDMNEATNGGAGKVAAYGTALLLAGGAITTVTGKIVTMTEGLDDVARGAASAGRAVLSPWGVAGILIGATAFGVMEYNRRADEAREATDRAADAIARFGTEGATAVAEVTAALADTDRLADMNDFLADYGTNLTAATEAALGGSEAWDAYRDSLGLVSDVAIATDPRLMALDAHLDAIEETVNGATSAAEDLKPSFDGIGKAAEEAADPLDRLSVPVVHLRDNVREATDAIALHIDKVNEWLGNQTGYRDQMRETNDAITVYLDAEGDLNDIFSDRSAAADDVITSIAETAQAYADSKGAVDGSRQAIDLQLESLQAMRAYVPAELLPMIDEYILRLGSIPADIDVNINQRIRTFETSSASGPGQGPIRVTRRVGGPIPGGRDQPVPVMAHGGEFVISADVVDAIKSGSPTLGLGGGGGGGGGYMTLVVPAGPTMSADGFMAMVREAERVYGGVLPIRVERASAVA